jgi:ferredoxin
VAARAGARHAGDERWQGGELKPLRKGDDVIEKCTFCYHRVLNGLQPACVEVCPSQARIFGDQEDPNSQISQILKKEKSFRLQEERAPSPTCTTSGSTVPRCSGRGTGARTPTWPRTRTAWPRPSRQANLRGPCCVDYTRLFLGAGAAAGPPYGSVLAERRARADAGQTHWS